VCEYGECRRYFNYASSPTEVYTSSSGGIACTPSGNCSKFNYNTNGVSIIDDSTSQGKAWKISRDSNGYVSVCFNPGGTVGSWTVAQVRIEARGQKDIVGTVCGSYQIYSGTSLGSTTNVIKSSTEVASDQYGFYGWFNISPPQNSSSKVCITVKNGNSDCSLAEDLRLYNIQTKFQGYTK